MDCLRYLQPELGRWRAQGEVTREASWAFLVFDQDEYLGNIGDVSKEMEQFMKQEKSGTMKTGIYCEAMLAPWRGVLLV